MKKVKPNTAEYASKVLKANTKSNFISESDSFSGCPSSSSDDESPASVPLYRLKHTLREIAVTKRPKDFKILAHKSTPEKHVIVIPSLLKKSKIDKLCSIIESSPCAYIIDDRKSDLAYSHSAHRVEVTLRIEYPRLYRKLVEMTVDLGTEIFGPLPIKKGKFYPEFEYIVYESDGAFIEPHVDNHSIVTGILMLSEVGVDFDGGINKFEGSTRAEEADVQGGVREYQLKRGDCILFRGEKLEHWITPVTSGVRKILQWEFSRI